MQVDDTSLSFNNGRANAYANSQTKSLIADDTLFLVQEGGEWAGLDLKITQVLEPADIALAGLGVVGKTFVRAVLADRQCVLRGPGGKAGTAGCAGL